MWAYFCAIYQLQINYLYTKRPVLSAVIPTQHQNLLYSLPNIFKVLRAVVPQHTSPDMPCVKEHSENLTLVKTVLQQAVACRLQESLFFLHCWGKEEKKSRKICGRLEKPGLLFSFFVASCFEWNSFREGINASLNTNPSGLTLSVPHTWLLWSCAQCCSLSMSTCTWRGRYFSEQE